MITEREAQERRKFDRIRIRSNLFATLGSPPDQKCIILDIGMGGLSFRYYEGSDLIKSLEEDRETNLDIYLDKADFHLEKVPFKTVYDARVDNKMPMDSLSVRKRGIKFGKLTQTQKSKLKDLVQNKIT
jgi:hypothetical protein